MTEHIPQGESPFRIDAEYDREHASNGVSRYAAYVRGATDLMRECWDGTYDDDQTRRVVFAAAAWATATGPVMSPGYVRSHPRVLSARLECNWWNASLAGSVGLVVPRPAPLARSRDWQAGAYWRDWPVESRLGEEYFHEPGDEERSQRPYLMTTAQLRFPLADVRLPAAPDGPDHAFAAARAVIEVLVVAMNERVTPIITTLDRS